jgi:ATP/maltotriose-dependent transcriptional regulator MalT
LATEPLTSKEYEILLDVANGLSNEDLCQKHFISLNTVKTHLKKIFSKLDVKNRTAALLKARNPGV